MRGRGFCIDRGVPRYSRVLLSLVAVLVLQAPAASAQSLDEAVVRLNGAPVVRVTGTEAEPAAERAARIQRRLERLADRAGDSARPSVVPGPDPATRIVQLLGAPIVTVTQLDADDHVTTVDALASQWAAAIGDALAEARSVRMSPWGRFRAEVRGTMVTTVTRLGESATRVIPRVLAAVAVIALFWALAAGVRALLRVIFRRIISDLTVENLLKQLAYYAVWAIGIFVAADALGFEPSTVVTGLGLTGLALGFALKDIISNFVSGVLLLALRPFEIGDEIVVGPTEGRVVRIELRATEIRTYDGRLVIVPNAELFTSRVTNNTAAPVRRATLGVPVGYDADLAVAERVLIDTASRADDVLSGPAPSVRVRELGPSDILLELRFWTDSRRSDLLATTSVLRRQSVQALRAAGVPLPDPDARRVTLTPPGEVSAEGHS